MRQRHRGVLSSINLSKVGTGKEGGLSAEGAVAEVSPGAVTKVFREHLAESVSSKRQRT